MPEFVLQGFNGAKRSEIVKEFFFVVNSCPSMEKIYKVYFDIPWKAPCKDYDSEILPKIKNITTQVKFVYAFFDPTHYNEYS